MSGSTIEAAGGRPPGRPKRAPACGVAAAALRRMIALLACAASLSARADFVDDYALGLKAIDDGRDAEAIGHLQTALAAQGEPVAKVVLNGSVEQPYLPYHFIGIANYRLGDCDAARSAWDNPVNQRMVGRLNTIRRLEQRMAADCKPRALAERPAPKPSSPPAASPAPSPPAAEPAPPPAPKDTENAASKPAVAPAPPRSAGTTEEARPPAALLREYDAFVGGRYAEVERAVPDALTGTRARFHSYLLRAAARFTAAQLGDTRQLAAARADARAAQAIDATAEPDADVFSPKFRAFYAQSRR